MLFVRFFKWKYIGQWTKSIVNLFLVTWLVEISGIQVCINFHIIFMFLLFHLFQLNNFMDSIEQPGNELGLSKFVVVPLFYTGKCFSFSYRKFLSLHPN